MSNAPRCQHIIVIDGTQSNLETGSETNAGIVYKLLKELDKNTNNNISHKERTLWYDPGVQGHGLWNWVTIASGWGINKSIECAYHHLAQKYRDGDQIFLFGFSRGAYAVRSLAGMIGKMGILRHEMATAKRIHKTYCMYERSASRAEISDFVNRYSRTDVPIEMVGVWDTVKALGLPYPLLTYLAPMATEFHDHKISNIVRNGFHALALDENRRAFEPVMWQAPPGWTGHLEQMWFKGAHADIGGHVWGYAQARPLSNIPLVWMLEKAEICGLNLPTGWKARFPCNANAPPVGNSTGVARFFLFREARCVGRLPSEKIHSSASQTHTIVSSDTGAKSGTSLIKKLA